MFLGIFRRRVGRYGGQAGRTQECAPFDSKWPRRVFAVFIARRGKSGRIEPGNFCRVWPAVKVSRTQSNRLDGLTGPFVLAALMNFWIPSGDS